MSANPETTAAISQRAQDNEPCTTCGGDRLRSDFTGNGRCHVARTDAPTETKRAARLTTTPECPRCHGRGCVTETSIACRGCCPDYRATTTEGPTT